MVPAVLCFVERMNDMICKVKMSHTVYLFVEGDSEETIQDWMANLTPEEAKHLAEAQTGNYIEHDFEDEILCPVRDDSYPDYIIGWRGDI